MRKNKDLSWIGLGAGLLCLLGPIILLIMSKIP